MNIKIFILSIATALSFPIFTYADTFEIKNDGTAYVEGRVIEHTAGCEVDGSCSLTVQANNQKVVLIYAQGESECKNTQAASWVKWGENIKIGSMVKAYGAYSKNGDMYWLVFCDSKDFYIKN